MYTPSADDDKWLRDAFERLALTHDDALRDEIVERTHWLALRGARRFASRGEPFDDLLQVARIGLLKAIGRFDPSMGAHFSAYATPTIMGELRRHFRDHTWSVHVPRRTKDLRQAVNETADELTKELGRSPRVAEIAERVVASEDAVLEALEANNAYRSSPLDVDGSSGTLAGPDEFDGLVADRETVLALLGRLGERERTILYLRFYEELTQAQIAERIGTSQVHVGRLIASSLAALRSCADEPDATGDTAETATGFAEKETG